MVLESIMNPLDAEKKPFRMFFIGAFYSLSAAGLSLWIFKDHASLVMVFLTVLACTPLMYNTIKMEEEKDIEIDGERTILREHGKALLFFMMLFFGITLSFTILYVGLPSDYSGQIFSVQQQTISSINGGVTSFSTTDFNVFSIILLNNVKVLVFCVVFALVYGLGAIFILVWNASVIATAMGDFFRQKMASVIAAAGFTGVASYFSAGLFSVVRYAPHGILEILAYFIAGLAGGIISIAVIRHDFGTKRFEKIVFDAANLLIISFAVLFIAALVETFITPLFFV